jgi:protein-disulfide isomerase
MGHARPLAVVAAAAALVLLLAGCGAGAGSPSPATPGTPQPTADVGASPGSGPPGSGPPGTARPAGAGIAVDGKVMGRADAPVTIEIWSDFQCPFCALFTHTQEPELVRGPVAAGEVRLVYRDYAFLGQESLDAAVAASCAADQDAFWLFADFLYGTQQGENQGRFSAEFLASLAEFIGLDLAKYGSCVADPAKQTEIVASTQEGIRIGVASTPTLRIIGPVSAELVKGFKSWPELLKSLDRVTGRAPATPRPTATPSAPMASPSASTASPSPAP